MATEFSGDTTKVCNTDVFSLHRRINRFMYELIKSQSSGVSQTMGFDTARVLKYLASIKALMTWITSQPLLDLPETGPQPVMLLENTPITNLENESVYDLVMMFSLLRDELANSQSARLSTGLLKYDHDRATAIVTKMELFVNSYISQSEPLDLPESSPLVASTGGGRVGI